MSELRSDLSFALCAVNVYCLHKQHLYAGQTGIDPVCIAKDAAGLHASSVSTPYLSLFVRSKSFVPADLARNLYQDRTLIKLYAMRRTLHIFPIDWLPVVYQATAKQREMDIRRELGYWGISDEEYRHLSGAILTAIENQPRSTNALARSLPNGYYRRISKSTSKGRANQSSNLTIVIRAMWQRGLLVRGQESDDWRKESRVFFPFHRFFPDCDLALCEQQAREELIQHYLAAYGPVMEEDIEWWTGFSKPDLRRALQSLENSVVRLTIEGLDGQFLLLGEQLGSLAEVESTYNEQEPIVALLPYEDPYLKGYQASRERYIACPEHARVVFNRSGEAMNSILVNGRVVGIWQWTLGDPVIITVRWLESLETETKFRVESEAIKLGLFIGSRCIVREDQELAFSRVPYQHVDVPNRFFGGSGQ